MGFWDEMREEQRVRQEEALDILERIVSDAEECKRVRMEREKKETNMGLLDEAYETARNRSREQLGKKYDSGKLMYHLVPWWANWILARVLTYGAEKYAPESWQHVPDAKNRYTSALIGHLEAWRGGSQIDSESKLPHLWHVFVNVMFLIFLEGDIPKNSERTIGHDDAPVS